MFRGLLIDLLFKGRFHGIAGSVYGESTYQLYFAQLIRLDELDRFAQAMSTCTEYYAGLYRRQALTIALVSSQRSPPCD